MRTEQLLRPRTSDEWVGYRDEHLEPRARSDASRTAYGIVRASLLIVATLAVGLTFARAISVAGRQSVPTRMSTLLERAAEPLSLGTTGLFVAPGSPLLTSLINAGVAAVVWALAVVVALWAIRPSTARRSATPRTERTGRASQLPRPTRVIFAVVAIVSLLELGGFNGVYLAYSQHYISTENATVDGDRIEINAPVSGVITSWALDEGSRISDNQIVGRVRPIGGGARPTRTVRAPGTGTVAADNVVEGAFVEAGTNLATAYDPARIYVTARINEDSVDAVHLGALVDLAVDAFPDEPMTGIVQVVQNSTASPLRTASAPGGADPSTPQAVVQYVPVKIALLDTAGHTLSPGMNVIAHIRK